MTCESLSLLSDISYRINYLQVGQPAMELGRARETNDPFILDIICSNIGKTCFVFL